MHDLRTKSHDNRARTSESEAILNDFVQRLIVGRRILKIVQNRPEIVRFRNEIVRNRMQIVRYRALIVRFRVESFDIVVFAFKPLRHRSTNTTYARWKFDIAVGGPKKSLGAGRQSLVLHITLTQFFVGELVQFPQRALRAVELLDVVLSRAAYTAVGHAQFAPLHADAPEFT